MRTNYQLATTTARYYHFVRIDPSGANRESYIISRTEFWGRKAVAT